MIRAANKLKAFNAGEVLKVVSTDLGALSDRPAMGNVEDDVAYGYCHITIQRIPPISLPRCGPAVVGVGVSESGRVS